MRVVNIILNGAFEILLVVPSLLFREAGLLLVSVLFGLAAVLVFGRLSNQEAIRRAKNGIKGHLLGLSLYPHEMGLALRTYGRVIAAAGRYLLLLLVPTLALAIPFLLAAIQAEARYGRVPLRVGRAAVVSAIFDAASDGGGDVTLEAPPGIEVETPRPIRIRGGAEAAWRIRAREAGEFTLRLGAGGVVHEKRVVVGEGVRTVSVERPGGGLISRILNPLEPPLETAGGLRAIRVEYPRARVSLLGWETHWLVFFLVVSIGSAVVARYPLRVEM